MSDEIREKVAKNIDTTKSSTRQYTAMFFLHTVFQGVEGRVPVRLKESRARFFHRRKSPADQSAEPRRRRITAP